MRSKPLDMCTRNRLMKIMTNDGTESARAYADHLLSDFHTLAVFSKYRNNTFNRLHYDPMFADKEFDKHREFIRDFIRNIEGGWVPRQRMTTQYQAAL